MFSETSPIIKDGLMCHKQWIRIVLVVAMYFPVALIIDPPWLSGCKTHQGRISLSSLCVCILRAPQTKQEMDLFFLQIWLPNKQEQREENWTWRIKIHDDIFCSICLVLDIVFSFSNSSTIFLEGFPCVFVSSIIIIIIIIIMIIIIIIIIIKELKLYGADSWLTEFKVHSLTVIHRHLLSTQTMYMPTFHSQTWTNGKNQNRKDDRYLIFNAQSTTGERTKNHGKMIDIWFLMPSQPQERGQTY